MKKSASLIKVLTIVIVISSSYFGYPGKADANWTFFVRKAQIDGYVFVDKRFQGRISGNHQITMMSRKDFFADLLKEYKYYQPVEGSLISIRGTKTSTVSDNSGFFKIRKAWLALRNKEIEVYINGSSVRIRLNLSEQLRNFLTIMISKDGYLRVYCLDEKNSPPKVSGIVVMVHGFGVDLGPFTPSKYQNSWKAAYTLFLSDPDLSEYEFFMPDHWDDQSLAVSSKELGCFLGIVRRAYGSRPEIIVLGHSAGGLIVRHYTVSSFYEPDTISRFLLLATPNAGSGASLIHFETDKPSEDDMDGDGSASKELLPGSKFLNCLNNTADKAPDCGQALKINENLQDSRGLNQDVPCAVLAGEVKGKIVESIEKTAERLRGWLKDRLDPESDEQIDQVFDKFEKMLDNIPPGDVFVSYESQLIKDVPYDYVPYPHGFIHRPKDKIDDRYLIMKRFILTGKLSNLHYL